MNQCSMQSNNINYLVVGAGMTGLSVVSYLRAHGHGVRVMDSRELPPNAKKYDHYCHLMMCVLVNSNGNG